MAMVKEKMKEVIEPRPDDATYEEILLARMIERGLVDSRADLVMSNEEMEHRIRSWQR